MGAIPKKGVSSKEPPEEGIQKSYDIEKTTNKLLRLSLTGTSLDELTDFCLETAIELTKKAAPKAISGLTVISIFLYWMVNI